VQLAPASTLTVPAVTSIIRTALNWASVTYKLPLVPSLHMPAGLPNCALANAPLNTPGVPVPAYTALAPVAAFTLFTLAVYDTNPIAETVLK
jgi:hypothetical protein